MPFPNEHAARIKAPGQYKRFRRKNDAGGDGVDFIYGIKDKDGKEVTEVQAIRFDKDKFTVAEAKKWLKDHDYTPLSFEPAEDKGESYKPSDYEKETVAKQLLRTYPQYLLPGPRRKRKKSKAHFMFGGSQIDPRAPRWLGTHRHRVAVKAVADEEEDDTGFWEGYGATFGHVDFVDEMFRAGAFKKSIKEVDVVPLMERHFLHGGDVPEMRGTANEFEEDEHGLLLSGDFEPDEASQRLRSQMVRGKVKTFSVGFRMVEWGFVEIDKRRILEHTQSRLLEVTATLKPINPMALLTRAKDMGELQDEVGRICELLTVKPDQLTSVNADRLLSEFAGGSDQAKAFSVGTHTLLDRIDELLDKVSGQGTQSQAGDTAQAKAVATREAGAALHDYRRELELSRLRVKRLLL